MTWNGSGDEPRYEGPSRCCGKPPMLRRCKVIVFAGKVDELQYQCATCGLKGESAITEPEAKKLWEDKVKEK